MLNRLTHTQLLRYAGLFTWVVLGIPLFVFTWYLGPDEGDLAAGPAPRVGVAVAAYLAFGLIYWKVTHSLGFRQQRPADLLLLAALTFSAILVSAETGTGMGAVLMMIIAGVIPWLVNIRVGVVWLMLQHAALIPVFSRMEGYTPGLAVMQALTYVGYSSFAMVIGLIAMQQAQAREEQRRLNAELRATRALLAESSRMSERVRISRELHDLLGHHLTALSLNLEVAGHLTAGKAQEHVRQSHTLAKLLLTDVREAVSEMRQDGAVDLSGAIRTLAEGVPALDIRLDMPEPLLVEDPECAHVMLRCAQEIITNAVRHAGASTLWLSLSRDSAGLRIQARDDGAGAEALAPGNGLLGMRERLASCGGRVDIITGRGKGFALDIRLPLEKPA
ncbi:sensor histidine kinase [Arenimonas caeni]|jgi:signal transduction histidine kinase|uniref:Sensor histidine kinase n=1 Tax=Arenimonas caeni TaxID=2058085 RepID=A0A2P6M9X2_9GAMM|nr:sensor histidine kinase [Arenimonas caeni]MDY0023231.1 sensor histidine kinase [Arenimonas caeni]PRH82781.1 sensor histidine kinase [Arenimonas caeni]